MLPSVQPMKQAISKLVDTADAAFLDIAERNKHGRTPIMLAAAAGSLEMVQVLAAERVRLQGRSEEGKLVIDYAESYPDIIEWMQQWYSGKIDLDKSIIAQQSAHKRAQTAAKRITWDTERELSKEMSASAPAMCTDIPVLGDKHRRTDNVGVHSEFVT